MSPRGFISPNATVYHKALHVGVHVFIDDRVMIFQAVNGGEIVLGDRVSVMRDVIMETRMGGAISIGAGTGIHPRCQIISALEPIHIGHGVGIAANCALYSYDHGLDTVEDIFKQNLRSKGGISIGDGAWLGTGVIVLSGVSIGKGAVIGAGSVVTHNVPDHAIAVGAPARVLRMRDQA
jgi:acetyltransferase-like isoleucine patch superfamily enzyme